MKIWKLPSYHSQALFLKKKKKKKFLESYQVTKLPRLHRLLCLNILIGSLSCILDNRNDLLRFFPSWTHFKLKKKRKTIEIWIKSPHHLKKILSQSYQVTVLEALFHFYRDKKKWKPSYQVTKLHADIWPKGQ